jgi:hypothetical protein
MSNSRRLVDKLWAYCNVLRDDGVGVIECTKILVGLAQQPGTLGTIFRKEQNRIQDPAKLKRLIVDLIDNENWSASGTDLKGDAYEALLSTKAAVRLRPTYDASPAHRNFLRPRCEGKRAPFRQEAGIRAAVEHEALGLRPVHQPTLHS